MEQTVHLKITSAIVVDGKLRTRGAIVSLPERQAVNLLERGKAVVATAEDATKDEEAPAPEAIEPATDAAPEPATYPAAEPEPEAPAPAPAADAKPTKGKK